MAKLPIEFSPSALNDLHELLDYYKVQGVEATGRRIAGALMDAVKSLPDHPQMGRIVPEFATPSLRELIRPPYRIVYRHHLENISIIRIWRSERLLNLPDGE